MKKIRFIKGNHFPRWWGILIFLGERALFLFYFLFHFKTSANESVFLP